MSKKKRNRFKKQLQAQILNQANRTMESPPKVANDSSQSKEQNVNPVEETIENSVQIKGDLLKTAVIVFILIAAMAAMVYFENKNGFLVKSGDWLFHLFNLRS